jgi:hypothetical protein
VLVLVILGGDLSGEWVGPPAGLIALEVGDVVVDGGQLIDGRLLTGQQRRPALALGLTEVALELTALLVSLGNEVFQ